MVLGCRCPSTYPLKPPPCFSSNCPSKYFWSHKQVAAQILHCKVTHHHVGCKARPATLLVFGEWYERARLAKAPRHSPHPQLLFRKQCRRPTRALDADAVVLPVRPLIGECQHEMYKHTLGSLSCHLWFCGKKAKPAWWQMSLGWYFEGSRKDLSLSLPFISLFLFIPCSLFLLRSIFLSLSLSLYFFDPPSSSSFFLSV